MALTKAPRRGPLLSVLCDVCGRDNPDRLLYCQDCGKRLKAPSPTKSGGGSAPAPPPLAVNDASISVAPATGSRGVAATQSEARRSRPEAPSFSFAPPAADSGPGVAVPRAPATPAVAPPPSSAPAD